MTYSTDPKIPGYSFLRVDGRYTFSDRQEDLHKPYGLSEQLELVRHPFPNILANFDFAFVATHMDPAFPFPVIPVFRGDKFRFVPILGRRYQDFFVPVRIHKANGESLIDITPTDDFLPSIINFMQSKLKASHADTLELQDVKLLYRSYGSVHHYTNQIGIFRRRV